MTRTDAMTDMTTIDYHGKPADCDLYNTGGDTVYIHHIATDTVISIDHHVIKQNGGFGSHCQALKSGMWEPGVDAGDAGDVYVHESGDTYRHQEHEDVTLSLDTIGQLDVIKIDHYDDDEQ